MIDITHFVLLVTDELADKANYNNLDCKSLTNVRGKTKYTVQWNLENKQ